jgi:hypothetical protein
MESTEGSLAHLDSSTALGAARVLERAGGIAGFLFIGALTDYAGYSGAIGIVGLIVLAEALGFVVSLEHGRSANTGRGP